MDRRTFMSLAFGAAATGWRDITRAEEHRALFWRIETPDNATGIVSDTRAPPRRCSPILSATAFA